MSFGGMLSFTFMFVRRSTCRPRAKREMLRHIPQCENVAKNQVAMTLLSMITERPHMVICLSCRSCLCVPDSSS